MVDIVVSEFMEWRSEHVPKCGYSKSMSIEIETSAVGRGEVMVCDGRVVVAVADTAAIREVIASVLDGVEIP